MTPPPAPAHGSGADIGIPEEDLDRLLSAALAEDLGPGPDVTSAATVPADQLARMDLVVRSPGVVAGIPVVMRVFELAALVDVAQAEASPTAGVGRHVVGAEAVQAGSAHTGSAQTGSAQTGSAQTVACSAFKTDGQHVEVGDVLLSATGPTRTLLLAERTALNLICHLSGVATATAAWADALEGTSARVRDTRKTTPGLRRLEKYAVRCGGGVNHRMGLWDAALIKDNHVVAAGGVAEAFRAVRQAFPGVPVEVEVDDLDQLADVVDAGADLVLLDNFTPEQTARAVAMAAGRCQLESSGGLTLAVAAEFAATGVDYLAVGGLTHSAPILDISAELAVL